MSVKDIFTIVSSEQASAHVIDYAEGLAARTGAHLRVLVAHWFPTWPLTSELWVANPWWSEIVQEAQKRLDRDGIAVRTRMRRETPTAEVESALLDVAGARAHTGQRALHADITILDRPGNNDAGSSSALLEGPLFDAGRPVIFVPPNWREKGGARKVLVCWKPTREAARALGDAEPFLAGAEKIALVTVDARPSDDSFGPLPGADISTHLARRGHKVELFNLASAGRTEAQTILDQANAIAADLIVMGGFGHSRLSEMIFGGVTRDILRTSNVPVLMSH